VLIGDVKRRKYVIIKNVYFNAEIKLFLMKNFTVCIFYLGCKQKLNQQNNNVKQTSNVIMQQLLGSF